MIKTLTKHGNSHALVIEKPILELLRVGPDTSFEVVTDGQCVVLTPLRDPEDEKRFEKALETAHKRFGRAMKRLAGSMKDFPEFDEFVRLGREARSKQRDYSEPGE